MELKPNMYVRTKKYGVAKIIGGVTPVLRAFNIDKFKKDGVTLRYQREQDVIKASNNIIDLIEVGDYVNGYKVIDSVKNFKVIIDKLELNIKTGLYHNKGITNENIKSIVTKEQFESMNYKIGD